MWPFVCVCCHVCEWSGCGGGWVALQCSHHVSELFLNEYFIPVNPFNPRDSFGNHVSCYRPHTIRLILFSLLIVTIHKKSLRSPFIVPPIISGVVFFCCPPHPQFLRSLLDFHP